MKKNHKKLLGLSIILIIISFTIMPINLNKVRTDSGFDSSYSSGGSFGSGGGYNSYGSKNNYSSYSSIDRKPKSKIKTYCTDTYEDENGYIKVKTYECEEDEEEDDESSEVSTEGIVLSVFIIIGSIILMLGMEPPINRYRKKQSKNKIKKEINSTNMITDLDEETINKILNSPPDIFIKERYQDYLEIQEAWMNFDYDKLRDKTTDELYNQYEMQLDTLKIKNQQNIMKKFNFIAGKIIRIQKENNEYQIKTYLQVEFKDYIKEKWRVVSGSKHKKIGILYEITFVKKENSILNKCPNCGAEVIKQGTTQCEYCRATITTNQTNWVMSKKINRKQY